MKVYIISSDRPGEIPHVALSEQEAILWEKLEAKAWNDYFRRTFAEPGGVFPYDSKTRRKQYPNITFNEWITSGLDSVYVNTVEVENGSRYDSTYALKRAALIEWAKTHLEPEDEGWLKDFLNY